MPSAPLAERLSIPGGPLFFPVTARAPDGSVGLDVHRTHVRRGVEAGVRLRGPDVGEVRPPLHEPAEGHVEQLARLIERGYALLEEDV